MLCSAAAADDGAGAVLLLDGAGLAGESLVLSKRFSTALSVVRVEKVKVE